MVGHSDLLSVWSYEQGCVDPLLVDQLEGVHIHGSVPRDTVPVVRRRRTETPDYTYTAFVTLQVLKEYVSALREVPLRYEQKQWLRLNY